MISQAVCQLSQSLPARAHDNGLFIIFSNGVGQDEEEVRTGNAMILDPYGRILVETWQAADAMVSAELDFSLINRCTGQRWIRGRRPELYGLLTKNGQRAGCASGSFFERCHRWADLLMASRGW